MNSPRFCISNDFSRGSNMRYLLGKLLARLGICKLLVVLYFCFSGISDCRLAYAENSAPALDVNAGVWNGGQAAFWDLNLIDHFRLFGFSERARGYQPDQPIKFSHALHVGENKMECQFCHWSVAKADFAAIPEMEVCLGCHQTLVNTERAKNSPEVKKLLEYGQKGIPIPWVKVHVMPDYLRFNHKRHVKGGVACHECHGQIPQMEVVERVSSMKMGWCISCHRERGTSIDCTTCHK